MKYHSTRSKNYLVEPSEAVLQGLAPDGGLFVPREIPLIDFAEWQDFDYQQIARQIFGIYFSDLSPKTIADLVADSYADNFSVQSIAPTRWLDDRIGFLELWHGPTLAFKDIALQFLPRLMKAAEKRLGVQKKVLILTATSGDTGKAAMEGFAGVDGFEVIVFYPNGGVSSFQKRQMLSRTEDNVRAISVIGDFDVCQRGVKDIFADPELNRLMAAEDYTISSANSINIGRLIPQTVYYIHAYLSAVRMSKLRYGDPLNVIVPTGNFGNILAACYAKEMGLPLGEIQLAANSNHVLADFLQTGVYDANRELVKTSSPSMDILVASNLERYLYLKNPDTEFINELMRELKYQGKFAVPLDLTDINATWADEQETAEAIRSVFRQYHYLIDPHTAVAYHGLSEKKPNNPTIITATASPFKFFAKILTSLGQTVPQQDDQAVSAISELADLPIPETVKKLWQIPQDEEIVIAKDQMIDNIYQLTYV